MMRLVGLDGVFVEFPRARELWIPAFAGMTEYFSDFAHFNSLPPDALISLRTTEKQCLVAHDIYLIINKLALKVYEVGKDLPACRCGLSG